jgi:undecaprenyl diphosphate synthase
LHENNVRLLHLGTLDPLPADLQRRVLEAIELTKDNTGMTVSVAFNYGGRDEIVEATRRMLRDGLNPDDVDEQTFSSYLFTGGMRDPDLIIRTAGEMRLSNFLIWQAAYAEYYSTPLYWPDFGKADLERAVREFGGRERRFGSLTAVRGGLRDSD